MSMVKVLVYVIRISGVDIFFAGLFWGLVMAEVYKTEPIFPGLEMV